MSVLAADSVTKRFGDVVALDGLSLEVEDGEFLVIVGASGCGKSTLLNLFAGFERPTKGRALLRGDEITGVEPRCGMVFQNYALFPWLTVTDNIGFGPSARGVANPQRVQELIEGAGELVVVVQREGGVVTAAGLLGEPRGRRPPFETERGRLDGPERAERVAQLGL